LVNGGRRIDTNEYVLIAISEDAPSASELVKSIFISSAIVSFDLQSEAVSRADAARAMHLSLDGR
jgi:hypothetical protein